jgi:hypothetical protein
MNVPYQYGSYVGVSGRTTRAYLSATYGEWNHRGYFNYPQNYRGVFHVLMTTAPRWESLASVLDGTSSTLAVGEKHIPQQKDHPPSPELAPDLPTCSRRSRQPEKACRWNC